MDGVFFYIPLELWKDIAERFLDPTSFGRLRRVNRALRDKLDEESKAKMVNRCTTITTEPTGRIEITFMNTTYTQRYIWESVCVEEWRKNGQYHNEGDEPAYVSSDGRKIWYKNGEKHRDGDLPAEIFPGDCQIWYKNGKKHRDNDLPAVVYSNNGFEWYQHGQLHREGGEPAVLRPINGIKQYWLNGERYYPLLSPLLSLLPSFPSYSQSS